MKSLKSLKSKANSALLLIFSSSLFADPSSGSDYNMPVGVTEVSQSIFDLHMVIFWICVWIGVVVFGVMFFSLWKYRNSRGAVPAKFHDNFALEIGWTVAATLILVVMAVPSTQVMVKAYDDAEGDINIMVTGYQWKWHYKYLEDDISFFSNLATSDEEINNEIPKGEFYLREVDEPLVIPVNKRVRFLITGNDVIHSWWVPDFAVKQDAIPGFINVAKTKINVPGVYRGNCTELCGERHAYMPIVVEAVTREEYDAWLQEKRDIAAELAYLTEKEWTVDELLATGEEIYTTRCAACHQPDGAGIAGFYPALAGSDIVINDKARQIEILMEGVRGSQMQSFAEQINEVEMAAVITFTKLSWGNGTEADSELVIPKDIVDYKNRDT